MPYMLLHSPKILLAEVSKRVALCCTFVLCLSSCSVDKGRGDRDVGDDACISEEPFFYIKDEWEECSNCNLDVREILFHCQEDCGDSTYDFESLYNGRYFICLDITEGEGGDATSMMFRTCSNGGYEAILFNGAQPRGTIIDSWEMCSESSNPRCKCLID